MNIYSAQISAGSLMINESRKVAELLLQKPDEETWRKLISIENILQKKSPATAIRQARLIRQRLELLDTVGIELIAKDRFEVSIQMLLLASIRHSRILGDFLIDFYHRQLNSLEPTLNTRDWDVFLYECEQRDPLIKKWTQSTRFKILQVILRILKEADFLDKKSLKITPPFLHPRVRSYIKNREDYYTLEAMEQKK